ncbi:MAG TPA: ketopantoate reductase family protein [Sphingobium sp.]|nr:ketopantoate reductase family protein [Sphingobium sp.]
MMQRIVVVGAGAMGCLFAARIAQTGAQVMLVDVDRARLDAIAREGIQLTDDQGERTVRLATGVAADVQAPIDLVLLFTKGMHSRAATRSIAHLAATGTAILTLQNGLGNPEIIAETFPADHILKGLAALPADLHGATGVSSHGSGHLELGPMTPAGTALAQAAAALLAQAGFDARFNPQVDVAIWEKVAFNAALNALAAIAGQPNAGMDNEPGRRIIAAMVDEVVATAHACGVAVDASRIRSAIDFALVHHHAHKASMLQDMIAGRATEVGSIQGAVCARARAAGIATPVTSTMTDLIRVMELARQ